MKVLHMLPDNGQVVCDDHLYLYGIRGGRDSRGDKIKKMTDADRAYFKKATGVDVDCEQCRGLN